MPPSGFNPLKISDKVACKLNLIHSPFFNLNFLSHTINSNYSHDQPRNVILQDTHFVKIISTRVLIVPVTKEKKISQSGSIIVYIIFCRMFFSFRLGLASSMGIKTTKMNKVNRFVTNDIPEWISSKS